MAKISVIIPAYNSQQFIRETLESLLKQTLKDIEVVIINDGSTDGTQKIIDEYTSKYDFFKSYYQENAGVSAARNNGLEKATGKYVVFLDADDYYSEGSLEAFYETAEKTDADIVIGRLATFGEGKQTKFNVYADDISKRESIDTFDKILLWNFLVGNKCYKRQRLVDSGVRFPAYRYSEEGAFFMSYVYTGAKISGTYDSIMYYRRHTAEQGLSVSQTVNLPLAQSFSGSLEMILDRAKAALENADGDAAQEYLQEILYKTAYILISQFYRLMWSTDDECISYCVQRLEYLKGLMTEDTLAKVRYDSADLHLDNMPRSKRQAADEPNVSVIIGKCGHRDMTEFFNLLYSQISPLFEVIVPRSMVDEGRIPEKYLSAENLVVIDDKRYMRKAKKAAKSKRRIIFKRVSVLDIRVFRLIYKVPLPAKLRDMFFPMIIKALNFVLVKKILK